MMELDIRAAIAFVYALIPLIACGGVLYWAHYKAKNKYIRFFLGAAGIVGAFVSSWYLILAASFFQ